MYPRENQHHIPVINDNREYGDYGFDAYDNSWQFSRDFEPRRRFAPYYEGRRYEDNASVSFSNHPLGPFTSNLNAAPRRQRVSFQDAFQDGHYFQDAFRQEFNKVSLISVLFL
jgi:hypothetical protein